MSTDPRIVNASTAALTDIELAALEAMVKHGDRAGYDVTYFAMTGNDATAGEAQVATFSERPGSIAFGANRLMQEAFKDVAQAGNEKYKGIWYLSEEVALNGLAAVRDSVVAGGTGVLTNDRYFDSATKAWNDNKNDRYFPANIIIAAGGWDEKETVLGFAQAAVITAGVLIEFVVNIGLNSAALMADPVLGAIRQSSNPGLLASALATWLVASSAGATFGKTDANMSPQLRIEGPEGFGLYVVDGRVVAATGTSSEGASALAASTTIDVVLTAAVTGIAIGAGPLFGLTGLGLISALRLAPIMHQA